VLPVASKADNKENITTRLKKFFTFMPPTPRSNIRHAIASSPEEIMLKHRPNESQSEQKTIKLRKNRLPSFPPSLHRPREFPEKDSPEV